MELVQLLVIAALIIWVLVGRLAGQPLTARRLLVIPAIGIVYGAIQLAHLHLHLTALDVAVLVVGYAVALGLGVLRGLTIRVYERGGHLWYRYTPMTLVIWVLSIGARLGIGFLGHALGDTVPMSTASLVVLGVTLLGEAAVVGVRARRSGVALAPNRRAARDTADARVR